MQFEGRTLHASGKDRADARRIRLNRLWQREYSKQFTGWLDALRDSGHPSPRTFAKALVVGGSLGIFFAVLGAHMNN